MEIQCTIFMFQVHETGMHTTRYMITVSPYVEFPARFDVYNITRAEDFEKESYPSHFMRHNFHKQGCSEACRNYSETNDYNVGCPAGHEPVSNVDLPYFLIQKYMERVLKS